MASNQDTLHADLSELLTILGMGNHARPQSPHEVFQEALGVLREKLAPMTTIEILKDVAEKQFAYWRERMRAEKCLEDGISEDGQAYTPIGDVAAWQGGYCNGRMGEAEWWIGTLRALAATPPEARQTETGWKPPAGWKLVPEKPTEEMVSAAWMKTGDRARYSAMLAAAPPPPAIGNLEGGGRS